MGIKDLAGFISFPGGFKILSEQPIDARYVGDNLDFLQSIVNEGAAYPGLRVFIKSENLEYIYRRKENNVYDFEVNTSGGGSNIISTELVGQDENGGNVYKQTFSNGFTSNFTAPKGGPGETGPQGENGLSPHIGENGNWFIGEEDTGVNAGGGSESPATIKEPVIIQSSSWETLSNSQPFAYFTKVKVTTPLNDESRVSIANTNPIFFANFGLALAAIDGQDLTVYATNAPVGDTTITLLINTKPTGKDVEVTIAPSAWSSISNSQPFAYKAEVSINEGIGGDTIVTLINDNPLLFATYGFVLAAASNQTLTIYATNVPVGGITLTVNLEG